MPSKCDFYKILFIFLCIFSLLGICLYLHDHHTVKLQNPNIPSIIFDFEKTSKSTHNFIKNNNEIALLDSIIHFQGNYSLHIPSNSHFTQIKNLSNIKRDSYLEISAYCTKESEIKIVAQNYSGTKFYRITKKKSYNQKWDFISTEFYIPKEFNHDSLNLYVWNPKGNEANIDLIKITDISDIKYPEYEKSKSLNIFIEDKQLSTLSKYKNQAFEKGIIGKEQKQYVSALVYGNSKMMEAKIRFKGYWLDHLHRNKWSFRIKLKDDSWNGMKTFSIQNPETRSFINEWFIHQAFYKEDILTTRYGFVPVYLNGKSLGIYAYEEHFEKQLLESQNRREAPIIAFNEELLWEYRSNGEQNLAAIFPNAEIKTFSERQIKKDNTLYQEFILSQNLLDMYRDKSAPASIIFDIEKMAKYLALTNSSNAAHSYIWHNMRFYYNPIISKLEPIAFDCYTDEGAFHSGINILMETKVPEYQEKMFDIAIKHLMMDSSFCKAYSKSLIQFSDSSYYTNLYSELKDSINNIEKIIKKEFPNYSFSPSLMYQGCDSVQKSLSSFLENIKSPNDYYSEIISSEICYSSKESYLHEFISAYQSDNKSLTILHPNPDTLYITYIIDENKQHHNINVILPPATDCQLGETDIDISKINKAITQVNIQDINGVNYQISVKEWDAPSKYNPLTELINNSKLPEYIIKTDSTLTITEGYHKINSPLIIPANLELIVQAGSYIDMINQGCIISFSPIKFIGNKDNPILFSSSDKSSKGICVLQAKDTSLIQHCKFSYLNNPEFSGWQISGAISFYESDVIITNTSFSNNNCEDMLNIVKSNFSLSDITFRNVFADAFDSDFCNGKMDNFEFYNIGNDAIDFSGSDIEISNCIMNNITDKAVSGGENSNLRMSNIEINNSNIAFASKDLSNISINGCKISNTKYGFVVFQKKIEYGPAKISVKNATLDKCSIPTNIEYKSELSINNRTIIGNKKNIVYLLY